MADGHNSKHLDLSHNNRGVWLIKVPKYIASKWEKAGSNEEVGKLKISQIPNSKPQVSLSLPDAIVNNGVDKIPKVHKLEVSTVTQQTLGIFSETKHRSDSSSKMSKSKLTFEGKVVQRLECRPNDDQCYMKLKLKEIKKAATPVRQTIQLQSNVPNLISNNNKLNVEIAERKKAEGRNFRSDKELVLEVLFNAFEFNQYYHFADLVKLTKQPVGYLKEILKEYCNYRMKPPHKNMWELKPENRHYTQTNQDNKSDSDSNSDTD